MSCSAAHMECFICIQDYGLFTVKLLCKAKQKDLQKACWLDDIELCECRMWRFLLCHMLRQKIRKVRVETDVVVTALTYELFFSVDCTQYEK